MKNIVLFITDQTTWRALPAYGNAIAKTPNIDRLAAGGAVMDGCYCPFPLCQPSRAALWTGRYPHETRVVSNSIKCREKGVLPDFPTLGEVFSSAGYETVHFGKRHDAGALRGFTCAPEDEIASEPEDPAFPLNGDTFRDNYTFDAVCGWLRRREDERPLFLVTDIVNPHNICGWVGANQGAHEGTDSGGPLPALPPNFAFDDIAEQPKAIQYVCCTNIRQSQTVGWTPENFREYLRAYYYFLNRADRGIGRVLDTLEERGFNAENTLFALTADHGDSMAARGRVNKQVDFYEETMRIPMIFRGPGIAAGKRSCNMSLLDLFPTLCGQAGIAPPEGLRGRDLSAALAGGEFPERQYVAGEWYSEWNYTVSPGRMIRTDRYKYTRYLEDGGEQLFDLEEDPYEKKNRIRDPEYGEIADRMRELLREHLRQTEDPFESLEWKADKRWRSHPPGYQNHRGIAAPMTGKEH